MESTDALTLLQLYCTACAERYDIFGSITEGCGKKLVQSIISLTPHRLWPTLCTVAQAGWIMALTQK